LPARVGSGAKAAAFTGAAEGPLSVPGNGPSPDRTAKTQMRRKQPLLDGKSGLVGRRALPQTGI